ncbi:MAG: hypothetical protein RLZZ599_1191 [Bacteroidota bacterium]|jgi:heme-degrading monooxygenase HmoA
MFSILYTFEVKPGNESVFEEAWTALTELFLAHAGSKGSRLHKTAEGLYVAYAQWPDRKTWENADAFMPIEAEDLRATMHQACSNIGTQFELLTQIDLIQPS